MGLLNHETSFVIRSLNLDPAVLLDKIVSKSVLLSATSNINLQ